MVSASIPAPSAPTPSPEQVASAWVAQSPARLIRLGDTGSFTFKFRNAGSVAWVKGTPAEVRLGIVGDDLTFARLGLAEKWPHPLRPALQVERVVRPGELATFTFLVRGSVTGTFTLPVRPVIDGVTWLNAEGVHTEIVVQAG